MEPMNEFEQLLIRDSSVNEEVKALIEKLNMMTQASATHAVHELPSVEPVEPAVFDDDDDDDDDTSELSGYSMLTPSAASKSERDDEKISSDQQVNADEQFHVPKIDVPDFDFEADPGNSHQHDEDGTTTAQPQGDDIHVFQTDCEPATNARKLVGIVITFEQGVDFDNGQHAVRFVGDHLGLSVGSQAKEIRVLSIEGNGHLEVSTPPCPEHGLDSNCLGHDAVELVAKIHRVDGKCRQKDTMQGNAPTVSSRESSFFQPHAEPTGITGTPSDRNMLLFHRTELAKARTLRALIGTSNAACSGNCPGMNIQETGRDAIPAEQTTTSATLSQLIDIAKARVHQELATHERDDTPEGSKKPSTKQKEGKAKKTKKAKNKCTSTVAYEKYLIITASVLLFAVLSLVFCLAGMITSRRGHCVGLWLGP
ncbi:hypothetical protein Q7P35_004904 [Cladosporium inversicolor]